MMWGWGYGPYGGTYGANFWWMGIAGLLMQLIFWVAIISFGIYLYRRYSHRIPTGGFDSRNPLTILRERYARGEIDSEEYHRRKQDLEKD